MGDKNKICRQSIPLPKAILQKLISVESIDRLNNEHLDFGESVKLNSYDFNFSLFYPRLVFWKEERTKDKGGKEKIKFKADENTNKVLKDVANTSFKTTRVEELLKNKNSKLDNYLSSLKERGIQVFSFEVETTSPFNTGLGSGHPTETAITLDRNIGVPYIPATSIKGVLRLARAINIAKSRDESFDGNRYEVSDEYLKDYFGIGGETEATRGQFEILDAYPCSSIRLAVDIINPHTGDYYSGKGTKTPSVFKNPIPTKFLVVPKGIKFKFRCAYIPFANGEKCNEQDVIDMFNTAFEDVGFGSKTSIGYGRFKILN